MKKQIVELKVKPNKINLVTNRKINQKNYISFSAYIDWYRGISLAL